MDQFENRDPHYRGMVDPITADKRNRVIPAYGIKRLVIKLDDALEQAEFGLRGDFLFCDNDSTGTAVVRLNGTGEDPMPLLALAGVRRIPYENIYITAAAQAGKVLNLWHGYGAEFLAPAQNIASIGSIINGVKILDSLGNPISVLGALSPWVTQNMLPVQDGGRVIASSYASTTSLAANTPGAIIAAAANQNGALIVDAKYKREAGVAGHYSMLAKATAPVSVIDGVVLVAGFNASGAFIAEDAKGFRLTAGLRLDRISSVAEGSTFSSVIYQLF